MGCRLTTLTTFCRFEVLVMWLALFFFGTFCTMLWFWCAGEINESEKSD